MSDRAAFEGDYADFKIVKTRSVAQLVVEIPIEQAAEVVRMFGVPVPGKPVRVAVARMAEPQQIGAQAEQPTDGREHGPFHTLSPTLQSVLRCKSPAFWTFLREKRGQRTINDEKAAAGYVRVACGVNSRSSFNGTAAHKWAEINSEFEAWSVMS